MIIGTIVGFILFLVVIACVVFAFLGFKKKKRSKILAGGISAAVALLLLIALPLSFHTVDAGEVAVVKHLGEAKQVREAGTYFDFWLTESYEKYDAKVQTLDISTKAYSKDAQTMDIAMTVQYQIDPGKAIEIAKTYGTLSTLSNRITSVSIERTKSILSSYSAMEIIETRATISPLVEQLIQDTVSDHYYVTINAVVLTNIDFSDAFEATVEQKMIAEQQKIQAEYEKQTAIIEAQRDLEVAKLKADAELYAAEQTAAAQIEIAKAEARATKLKSVEVARALGFKIDEEIITDKDGAQSIEYTINFEGKTAEEIKVIADYLKYIEYLSKWNGELPDVMTGDSATVMIPTNPVQ